VVSSDQWLLHLLGTDVWHKIIRKRFSWKKGKILLIFVETVKNQTPNCQNLFVVSIIALLLQIHNKKCTLHNSSSSVEILQN
jgi:hypothetical protein